MSTDEELQNALDQDLGEFEWERSRVGGAWEPEPNFPDFERKVVTTIPPVTIHVGKIPISLNRSGLGNIFSKFGDILRMDLIRGKMAGGFNFAFVTYCSRFAAAEAVAMVNRAPPLHLVVSFKISDKQKAERLEQEKMAEEFNVKWNNNLCPGGEEMDYDEEIAREKKMEEEVDNFFDSSSSDMELARLHSSTKEKVVKAKCRRCGKEAQARCSTCKNVKYCGAACQGLDWPGHRKVCGERKEDSGDVVGGVEDSKDAVNEDNAECSEVRAVDIKELTDRAENVDDVESVVKDEVCTASVEQEDLSDQEEFVSLVDCVGNLKEEIVKDTVITKDTFDVNPEKIPDKLLCTYISTVESNASIPEPTMSKDAKMIQKHPPHEVMLEKDLPKFVLPDGCTVWLKDISADRKWGVLKTVDGVGEKGERDMLEDVMEVCRELDSLMVAPVVGQLVGVWQDRRWVRGVVEKVDDDGCVWLHGVDHICYMKIDQLSNLKHLPEVSLLVSAQCNTVRLDKNRLDRNMVDKVFRVNIRGEKTGFLRVELIAANNDDMNKCGDTYVRTETCMEAKGVNVEKKQSLTSNVTLKVGKMMDLTVLHVESPTALYMCPVLGELKEFQKHLYKTASELTFDYEFVPEVGSIVLARTKSDGYWYRVRVISCMEGRVTFFCPDFGFMEEVKLESVRRINSRLAETFLSKKFFACRCVLSEWRDGRSSPTELETAAFKKIVKISDKTVKVKVVEKRDGFYVVDIPGVDKMKLAKVGEMEKEVARIRKDMGRMTVHSDN